MKEKDLQVSLLLDFYGEILTKNQRDVLELYYDEDMSLSEIAAHSHISRQGVRDSIKRGEATLFDMESKLKMAERFNKILTCVSEIKQNVTAIKELNSKKFISSEIANALNKIQNNIQIIAEQSPDDGE